MSNENTPASSAPTVLDHIVAAHGEAFPGERVKSVEIEDQTEKGRTVYTIFSEEAGENRQRTWQIPYGTQDIHAEMLRAFRETPVS